MSASLQALIEAYSEEIIDDHESECVWTEEQMQAVNAFKSLFKIGHPVHDYFRSEYQNCMVVRFKRTPRGSGESEFYCVNIEVHLPLSDLADVVPGVYILLDGKNLSATLSPKSLNVIMRLYNSIRIVDSES